MLNAEKERHIAGPIRDSENIETLRRHLSDKPRDLLLFDLAVETGIGMKRLLPLKVKDLTGMKNGEKFSLGNKRDKKSTFMVNETIYKTFHRYLKKTQPAPNDYLFKSKKRQLPLNLSSVSNMINGWYSTAGIKGCYGAISLRKTWEFNNKDKTPDQSAAEAGSNSKANLIFKPLEATTVQRKIFKELFKAIVSRKIPPGTRITADEISRAFKVSQAPVRVAMNWLEARGFIVSQRKKGSIVRELTTEELYELVQVRLILELAAAKLACKAITDETLHQLESIVERYKQAYAFEDSDKLNRQFHKTLYQDINMPLLTTIVMDLYDRFSPYAALAFADHLDHEPDQNIRKEGPGYYHAKIIEGLRRRDTGKVLKFLEMKLRRGMLLTEEIMKQSDRIDAME
ncbi:MAG: FCD domain-containing protein [Deltaproteobacteria bacterium]|nr:FCD domain-containing protein [Deltaproteobacteria bacterium]